MQHHRVDGIPSGTSLSHCSRMAAYLKRASNASLPVKPEASTRGRRTSGCAARSRSLRTCSAGTTTILLFAGPASAVAAFAGWGVGAADFGVRRRIDLIEVLGPFEGSLFMTTFVNMVRSD